MENMIERIAFALDQADTDFSGVAVTGDAFPRKPTPKSIATARAVLEAMRDSTPEMDFTAYGKPMKPKDVWTYMIDAALGNKRF